MVGVALAAPETTKRAVWGAVAIASLVVAFTVYPRVRLEPAYVTRARMLNYANVTGGGVVTYNIDLMPKRRDYDSVKDDCYKEIANGTVKVRCPGLKEHLATRGLCDLGILAECYKKNLPIVRWDTKVARKCQTFACGILGKWRWSAWADPATTAFDDVSSGSFRALCARSLVSATRTLWTCKTLSSRKQGCVGYETGGFLRIEVYRDYVC